jgi:hypothetical protein
MRCSGPCNNGISPCPTPYACRRRQERKTQAVVLVAVAALIGLVAVMMGVDLWL